MEIQQDYTWGLITVGVSLFGDEIDCLLAITAHFELEIGSMVDEGQTEKTYIGGIVLYDKDPGSGHFGSLTRVSAGQQFS